MRQRAQLVKALARNHNAGSDRPDNQDHGLILGAADASSSLEGLHRYPAERDRLLVGLKIKADAASPGFCEAVLTGLGAAGFAPDLFPDFSSC